MNKVQRDSRGRPVEQVAIKTLSKDESAKERKSEQQARLDAATRAVRATRKANENEARVVKPLLESLAKNGHTCGMCDACDVRVVGYCSSPAARGALSEWDGIIQMPLQFGCALWRPRGKR